MLKDSYHSAMGHWASARELGHVSGRARFSLNDPTIKVRNQWNRQTSTIHCCLFVCAGKARVIMPLTTTLYLSVSRCFSFSHNGWLVLSTYIRNRHLNEPHAIVHLYTMLSIQTGFPSFSAFEQLSFGWLIEVCGSLVIDMVRYLVHTLLALFTFNNWFIAGKFASRLVDNWPNCARVAIKA